MRWFQIASAFVLVIAIAGIVWLNRTPLPNVELVYIAESGFSNENTTYVERLGQYQKAHERISLRVISSDPQQLSEGLTTSRGPQRVLVGCFTGTCKMQVLDILDGSVTPFLFLGRSHGLVKKPNLWHLGPIFPQSLHLLLPMISARESGSVHLLGEQDIDSHMTHYILKQYMNALDFEWGRSLLMTKNTEDVITDIIDSTTNDLYINTACGEAGLKIYRWIDESLQKGIHTCLDPIAEASLSQHWFVAFSEDIHEPQLLSIWPILKQTLHAQIDSARWSLSSLAGMQFLADDKAIAMHIQNQHMWHHQYLFSQSDSTLSLVKTVDRVEPVVFPALRQPTDWDLQMQLYWRNKNGRWQSP